MTLKQLTTSVLFLGLAASTQALSFKEDVNQTLNLKEEVKNPFYAGASLLIGKNEKMNIRGTMLHFGHAFNKDLGVEVNAGYLQGRQNFGETQLKGNLEYTVKNEKGNVCYAYTGDGTTGKPIALTKNPLTLKCPASNVSTVHQLHIHQIPMMVNLRHFGENDRFSYYIGFGVGAQILSGHIRSTTTQEMAAIEKYAVCAVAPDGGALAHGMAGKDPVFSATQTQNEILESKRIRLKQKVLFTAQAFVGVGAKLTDQLTLSVGARVLYTHNAKHATLQPRKGDEPVIVALQKSHMQSWTPLAEVSVNYAF
jgi:hypothetical protein